MASVGYYTLDVFTDRAFAGNQLAVFPDASAIPESRMQSIAREFNLSETVFVLPPGDPAHTARVRIFTPARELPFAGHPTIGTAVLLASLRESASFAGTLVLEEGVGPVPVRVEQRHGISYAQLSVARLPERGPKPPQRSLLARSLSLEEHQVGEDAAAYSCGVPYLFVPVVDRAALAAARVNDAAWRESVSAYWAPDVYVFTEDVERTGSHFRARMFGPDVGVAEDPATGSAAAAFAGYLAARDGFRAGAYARRIEQGFEMGRPSIIDLEYDVASGAIAAVRVGGHAIIISRGELLLLR